MNQRTISRLIGNYAMAGVLILLCVYYSWVTLRQQNLSGSRGAAACFAKITKTMPAPKSVLIVAGAGADDVQFAQNLERSLRESGVGTVTTAGGEPRLARQTLQATLNAGHPPDVVATTEECSVWLPNVLDRMPAAASARVVTTGTYLWPTFLQTTNLLNVANQIVIIAIIAVGMTMVIVTGGIDLSVGSLVALSAVITALLIRDRAGGSKASTAGLVWCSLAAIAAAGAVGAFSGTIIAFFRVPPFIVTLSMMQVASGMAYILAEGQSISDLPQAFTGLGRGTVFGLPDTVLLMAAVYVLSHLVMARTRLGRYVYAVGGNAEAARLAGVQVWWVLIVVYIISGISAGVGGVILASQLKSGSPTYGALYELYVIAAVVLGGTSLAGGSGKILGTLIGALIISVIQNGMNLTGVESYRQKVVLGFVILGAALLDTLKTRSLRLPNWLRPSPPIPTTAAPALAE